MAIKIKRYLMIVFIGICTHMVALTGIINAAQNDAAVPSPRLIRFASVYDVLPGIDTEDARLSLEMVMRKTMTRQIHPFEIDLAFITDFDTAAKLINKGDFQFVTCSGMDYLLLQEQTSLSPILVASRVEHPTEELLLVVRKGTRLEELGRKPGSTLILQQGRIGANALVWLETVLWEAGLPNAETHFGAIQHVHKTSRILLPVFFGKADACVINASAFDLMADLNPQIGKQLVIFKRSGGLVSMLVCATPMADEEDRAALDYEADRVMNDDYTRQAMTLVQMKRFFPYQPEYLATTEAIFKRYQSSVVQRRTDIAETPKATQP